MSQKKDVFCRVGKVGGQAVIEGVMMRGPKQYTTAVRKSDGSIVRDTHPNASIKDKYKFLNIPVVRGVVNFVEMLALSMKTLTFAADALGLEAEEETKFDKWLSRTFGDKLVKAATVIGAVLGAVLAIFLFMWLPALVSKAVGSLLPEALAQNAGFNVLRSVMEGLLKIAIFVLYIFAVSFMPDIRRTFEYHGAEHKSIYCYEKDLELTVENVKKQKRQHPRCGTSFMIVMMVIGIIISSFLSWDNVFIRTLLKLLTLPLVVGVGYEFLRYAGRHDNVVTRVLSAPGMWMQNLTTREPDAYQIEAAIVALKSALPEEFPEESVFENIKQPEPAPAPEPQTDPAPEPEKDGE